MALDPVVATNIANEARRNELRLKIANMQGQSAALASQAQAISNLGTNVSQMLRDASAQLSALEQGAGPGVTDDFDALSATDQALRAERYAGKAAWVDFVKANPSCLEADALPAYTAAALAARPATRQWLLHDPTGLRKEYAAALVAGGYILDTTWESWRAWILATPRDVILGLS